ncbi:MAG: transglycosylase domain-containing protein [Mycobacteriales bacterium]
MTRVRRARLACPQLAAAAVLLAVAASACLRTLPVDPALLGGDAVTTTVVAADGSFLTTLHAEEDRRPLPLAQIPKVVVRAVLAAEDRRFYEHHGVDARGVARAALADAKSRSTDQGGSTITQQLVKNTLVTPEKTVKRKVREAALALGLERSLSKDQILERYLNTVYFGNGAYGVGAATRVYFGHSPDKVSLAEAALLAGLIRSPASADPVRAPTGARSRRAAVLRAMVQTRAITAAQEDAANHVPLPRRVHKDNTRYPAAYAVQDAVGELLRDKRLGATPDDRLNALYRGGLTVRLTIDPNHQRLAEEAVRATLTGPHEPAAAVAALRPHDGAITAMVGGRDFFSAHDRTARVNLARGGVTKRQAGSTFKVFTLIAALEAGIKPEDKFTAGATASLPRRFTGPWDVTNYEGSAFGAITLREATEKSVNTAFARVVARLGDGDVDKGTQRVVDVAEALGIRGAKESRVRRDPATTLGSQEVDPVEMAAAYATLAAGGVYAKPYLVASVTDRRGRVLVRNKPQLRRVVPEGIAAIANDMLTGVIRHGTGVGAALPRPMAGKTGTSTGYHDAWFVGYTPNFAAAVWLGVPTGQVSLVPENGFRTVIAGGTFPAQIWSRFAGAALLGIAAPPFESPESSTIEVPMDVGRGCRPNQWTPPDQITVRLYLKGTEPTEVCTAPTGPPATEVPLLLGMQRDYAARRLDQLGFRSQVVPVFDPNYPPGVVVGQQPPSGATVAAGSVVSLRVSAREGVRTTVPDLLGMDTESAERALSAAGLRAVVSEESPCAGGTACDSQRARASGRVWRQDVVAGTELPVGSAVGIAVGPAYNPPPPSAQPSASASSG